MPSTTLPATATGLPTRRTAMLASLAGLGAALALPKGTKATAMSSPDADLITAAAVVEEIVSDRAAAWDRMGALEAKARDLIQPEFRPHQIETPSPWDTDLSRHEDGGFTMVQRHKAVDPAATAAKAQNEADIAAWDAEWKRVRRQVGHDACFRKAKRLSRWLEDATCALTPMTPKTLAGLTAKARAARALDPHEDCSLNGWEHELMASVLRDAIAIGGAA